MSQFVFKMPDLGEGTVDAEIVMWRTKPGDVVEEDQVIVEVMTDKAAVEVPAPVSGRVVSITGEPGDKVAVGSPLIIFETGSQSAAASAPATAEAARTAPAPPPPPASVSEPAASSASSSTARASAPASAPEAASAPEVASGPTGRVMTSPANRRRAREAGIDLHSISGTGPGGRIVTSDVLAATGQGASGRAAMGQAETGPSAGPVAKAGSGASASAKPLVAPAGETTEIKVIGVRRVIAERMSEAKRTIPHFAYVEEVDVTELESLRAHLNARQPKGEPGLTYLPLVIMALTRALESFPQCNVLYDSARGVLVRHRPVHVGIATQTPDGLKVPVVRNAQALSLSDLAAAIRNVSDRARSNKATREELTGSTITVTSLGKLGGIASTPVINSPEVAIIGLNKAVDRPVVHNGAVAVRRIMNLSSSFDHRFVDGYDAAAMIQALKDLLEHPATIFIPKV